MEERKDNVVPMAAAKGCGADGCPNKAMAYPVLVLHMRSVKDTVEATVPTPVCGEHAVDDFEPFIGSHEAWTKLQGMLLEATRGRFRAHRSATTMRFIPIDSAEARREEAKWAAQRARHNGPHEQAAAEAEEAAADQ